MAGWFPPAAGLPPPRRVATPRLAMLVAEGGKGQPVVFLHGLGWDHTLWNPTLARLAPRHRVVAADTRGHGGSDAPPGPYGIAQFAEDWAALLDALGVRGACLVGLSQGGMVAQALALARPDLVASLVLASTACRSHPAARENMEARIAAAEREGPAAAAEVAARSIFSEGWRAANPEALRRFLAWRTAMPMAPLNEAVRAAYGFDLRDRLPGLAVPTLVVAGAADTLTPPANSEEIAALIPGAALRLIPEAGHILPVEQPAAFAALLDGFLARHHPA
ncbi:alpha/beta hydrolase [Roseomonas sp. NAR14]|uniref:Alpha/beta hydrolase n=1 Tax=Roseomonas acroporae TaxID=2937791 RepID=A0A9X2BUR6_9PROT|nr:alpha/beta fold hydrolase [Roseomonas acroporae]MCK8785893.1 alpha/beta hydrolase [Roseomonas acroporae]